MNGWVSRSPITLRDARVEDAVFVAGLWSPMLRRSDAEDQAADVRALIATAEASPGERLVVAEYDGEPAGAVLLRISTITPINLEPTVETVAPYVAGGFRRRGVGRALMEAAVNWAEEMGVGHVSAGAAHSERDANRFLARLGLGSQHVVRSNTTHAVRTKLNAQRPHDRREGRVPLGQVLAARRAMRRTQPQG